MQKVILAVVICLFATLGWAGASFASLPSQVAVQEQVGSAGPMSFQMFCAMNAAECRPGGASKITLDQDTIRMLAQVNAKVNRAIRPKLDTASLQVWRVNPSSGDCKSYVVSKRHQLISAGFPASALRIAYVKTRRGEGHAVLVVKTSQGDLALDNLTGDIKPLRDTGYRIVAMSQADPRRWG